MNKRNFDFSFAVEDALEEGYSVEEILTNFAKQVATAEKEHNRKKEKETEKIDSAREKVVDTLFEYVVALGLANFEDVGDAGLRKEITDMIKDTEKSLFDIKGIKGLDFKSFLNFL